LDLFWLRNSHSHLSIVEDKVKKNTSVGVIKEIGPLVSKFFGVGMHANKFCHPGTVFLFSFTGNPKHILIDLSVSGTLFIYYFVISTGSAVGICCDYLRNLIFASLYSVLLSYQVADRTTF
jgi:hypothetical protein